MKKEKIVLFHPNPFSATRAYSGAPLGLLSISRILDKEGYDIKIISPITHKKFIQDIIKECKDALCFGITSITGYQIKEGRDVSKEVKKRYPKLAIIWGGWHPSILPIETIKDEYVDIIVKGQGEITFTELVHCIENTGDKKEILGITYMENGKIINNPDRPLVNLDELPPIPYHLIDVDKFVFSVEYGERALLYFTSYGCPHRCGFCVEQIVTKKKWVALSPEKIVNELIDMKNKYKIDSVSIIDSNFFVNRKRVEEFCRLMIEKNVNLKWGNVNGRTATLKRYSDETWQLMKKSGIECILTGVESGDQKTLDFMSKDIHVNDVLELARNCYKYNIKILGSYLIGFPWSENEEECHKKVEQEIQTSLLQVKQLLDINPRIRFFFAQYLPYPSTSLFAKAESLGLELPNKLEDWSDFLMTAEDATKMKVRQKWIRHNQAVLVLLLSIYIFFFIDPESYQLLSANIQNKYTRFLFFFVFHAFKSVVKLRWKYSFFRLPIDFYLYNFLRKNWKFG